MNKAFVAALACATTSAVKINATAKITTSDVCGISNEDVMDIF
jgi:hypothetical protein